MAYLMLKFWFSEEKNSNFTPGTVDANVSCDFRRY